MAHAYAPDTIAVEFEKASPNDKKAAIQFLATKANTTFGPARANLIELACRIAEMLDDLADLEEVAPLVTPTVLGEARGDRWRHRATPGALLLGLLDPQSDPLDQLGSHTDVELLIGQHVFERITPALEHISAPRAYPVHRLLLDAYPEHPEPLLEGLQQLARPAAERLWADVQTGVEKVFDDLLQAAEANASDTSATSTRAAATAGSAISATTAATSDDAEPETAVDRYENLLVALSGRETPAPQIGADVLRIGINRADGGENDLYTKAHRYADDVVTSCVTDATTTSNVALAALAVAPTVDMNYWQSLLDPSTTVDPALVEAAVDRILWDLGNRASDALGHLVTTHAALEQWVDNDRAARTVQTITTLLRQTAFGDAADPDGLRRMTAYALLAALDYPPDVPDLSEIQREDIEEFLAGSQPLAAALKELLALIEALTPADAADLDGTLAEQQKTTSAPLLIIRLRIRARARGNKKPVPVSNFIRHLADDGDSAAVLTAWLQTNPPIKDVETALARSTIGQSALSHYAQGRTAGDRSRLWITLYDGDYDYGHLTAVGRHGVNATVVDHVQDALLGADLSAQKTLTSRLLTADLSKDTSAKKAASMLTLALLRDGRVGSGYAAAGVVLNARGAASGLTVPLRKAFDKFTTAKPAAINRGDVRALNNLKLLTKKKGNPVSSFLKWFD